MNVALNEDPDRIGFSVCLADADHDSIEIEGVRCKSVEQVLTRLHELPESPYVSVVMLRGRYTREPRFFSVSPHFLYFVVKQRHVPGRILLFRGGVCEWKPLNMKWIYAIEFLACVTHISGETIQGQWKVEDGTNRFIREAVMWVAPEEKTK